MSVSLHVQGYTATVTRTYTAVTLVAYYTLNPKFDLTQDTYTQVLMMQCTKHGQSQSPGASDSSDFL